MTQQRREAMTGSRRPAHRVDLRVTDAAGKELYQNLIRRRNRKINFIHNQGLIGFYENCRPTLDAHPASLLVKSGRTRFEGFLIQCGTPRQGSGGYSRRNGEAALTRVEEVVSQKELLNLFF